MIIIIMVMMMMMVIVMLEVRLGETGNEKQGGRLFHL